MTRRSSLRASAREIYAKLAEGEAGALKEAAPDPPSPCSGATDLTARVRALYEDSAVPVAKIAVLAGVTERTIYKYVARHGWTRRYRRMTDGSRPPGFAPIKGAGGRFIARTDKDKPAATGLKATDAAGHDRALAACEEAARLSDAAQAKALADKRRAQADVALRSLNLMLAEYNAFRNKRNKRAQRRQPPRQQEAAKTPAQWRAPSRHPNPRQGYAVAPEPSKERVAAKPARRRGESGPSAVAVALEALYVQLVEKALAQWQALLDAA